MCYLVNLIFLLAASVSVNVHSFQMKDKPVYSRYQIGKWTYGDPEIQDWGTGSTLVIGKFCSIALDVKFLLGGEHNTRAVSTYPFNVMWLDQPNFPNICKGDIIVGNDVWIGNGALILSGITIGDGAVIGARSVVTKNVEPYTIVAGVPARPIRKRFPPHIIEKLLQIAWWNWSDEQIKAFLPLIISEQVETFVNTFAR